MTEWHLINNDGDIVRTAIASTKREAEQILGPRGTVVSALSWKHDYHTWRPVRTVVTEIVQPKEKRRKLPAPQLKPGYVTVNQMRRQFDAREGKIRRVIQQYGIPHELVLFQGRWLQTYSPKNAERIRKHLNAQPERIMPRSAVEKRRQAYLERMRQYYLDKKHSREARRTV